MERTQHMTDTHPDITLGLDDQGAPQVVIGEATETADLAQILASVPTLRDPSRLAQLAQVVNHLGHGGDFRVITNPADFEARYRARLATENQAEEWREGVIRLCDHGVPDFATIAAPASSGDGLVFFAEDRFMGLPYRVQVSALGAKADYTPVPLTPVPAPEGRSTPPAPDIESPDDDIDRPRFAAKDDDTSDIEG
jgi:hypothetical protein